MKHSKTKTKVKTPTQLLRKDHQKVKTLFSEFEKTENASHMKQIFESAAQELKIHTKVEEDLFYPAAEKAIQDEELICEAFEEHHVVDLLMGELEMLDVHDPEEKKTFRAKFTVLMENVKHHIKEEENHLFPKFEKTKSDKKQLLEQMLLEKQNLEEEFGEINYAQPSHMERSFLQ